MCVCVSASPYTYIVRYVVSVEAQPALDHPAVEYEDINGSNKQSNHRHKDKHHGQDHIGGAGVWTHIKQF